MQQNRKDNDCAPAADRAQLVPYYYTSNLTLPFLFPLPSFSVAISEPHEPPTNPIWILAIYFGFHVQGIEVYVNLSPLHPLSQISWLDSWETLTYRPWGQVGNTYLRKCT